MHRRSTPASPRPLEWQPLVTACQWAILAEELKDHSEVLDDLRVVLIQLSPGVRSALMANLLSALAAEERPTHAVWLALAITGHEVKLCSAAALGRLDALGDDAPGASVRPIPPTDSPTRRASVDWTGFSPAVADASHHPD
jgi:hypothetical protein